VSRPSVEAIGEPIGFALRAQTGGRGEKKLVSATRISVEVASTRAASSSSVGIVARVRGAAAMRHQDEPNA